MNPAFFGDSYDLVKRFFCAEISSLGYSIAIDPMFTGDWSGTENAFYRLLGAEPNGEVLSDAKPRALFLDPDTGVKQKGSKKHVSFARLAQETKKFQLVFSFDHSFSRQANPVTIIREKLAELRALGCHAMYYDSHARFLFASAEGHPLSELRAHLLSLGLPSSRLIESGT